MKLADRNSYATFDKAAKNYGFDRLAVRVGGGIRARVEHSTYDDYEGKWTIEVVTHMHSLVAEALTLTPAPGPPIDMRKGPTGS